MADNSQTTFQSSERLKTSDLQMYSVCLAISLFPPVIMLVYV